MTERSQGGRSATADQVNARLVELLETVVANQATQAVANLHGAAGERNALQAWASRDSGQHRSAGLRYDQQRLVLRFAALLNGLGNFGRHGEQITALMKSPLLYDDGTLSIVEALPPQAETLYLFKADGQVLKTVHDVGGTAPQVDDAGDTAFVQVDDAHDIPILLGFPVRVSANCPQTG